MKVYDLGAGMTVESADGLIVTLLEKRCAGCWLVIVLGDFYPGAKADPGFVTPIVFHQDTVEEEGWRVL